MKYAFFLAAILLPSRALADLVVVPAGERGNVARFYFTQARAVPREALELVSPALDAEVIGQLSRKVSAIGWSFDGGETPYMACYRILYAFNLVAEPADPRWQILHILNEAVCEASILACKAQLSQDDSHWQSAEIQQKFHLAKDRLRVTMAISREYRRQYLAKEETAFQPTTTEPQR